MEDLCNAKLLPEAQILKQSSSPSYRHLPPHPYDPCPHMPHPRNTGTPTNDLPMQCRHHRISPFDAIQDEQPAHGSRTLFQSSLHASSLHFSQHEPRMLVQIIQRPFHCELSPDRFASANPDPPCRVCDVYGRTWSLKAGQHPASCVQVDALLSLPTPGFEVEIVRVGRTRCSERARCVREARVAGQKLELYDRPKMYCTRTGLTHQGQLAMQRL
ncbi:hypothetical protein F5141DRAFT_1148113 [Pisolithus sp. B1]|nr:hypothetical protein F5141DRAFT_1148113 [Pisolithus sp. B1]